MARKHTMRRFHVAPQSSPNSEINITPLVDVVLVLLIIFMVVTPLLEKDIEVRVPDSEQVEEMSEKDIAKEIKRLEKLMLEHARNLEFEQAARVRDQLSQLKDRAFGAHGGDSVAL